MDSINPEMISENLNSWLGQEDPELGTITAARLTYGKAARTVGLPINYETAIAVQCITEDAGTIDGTKERAKPVKRTLTLYFN